MLERVLEPEVMDDWQEATAYDAMDFSAVNRDFALTAIDLYPQAVRVLDIGTGTARIPIMLCQEKLDYQILGVDLAQSMLILGRRNIEEAGLLQYIRLELADGKRLPYPNWEFDLVISNSLVHHLPDPQSFFQEVARLVKPNGAVLIRDLLRPNSVAEIDQIVAEAGDYGDRQNQLFRDSLAAALTLDEVQELVTGAGMKNYLLEQSSIRHWTLAISSGDQRHSSASQRSSAPFS
jgi:ubiquinone/menaquinone biosynthesis C-methylase UbiE